MGTGRPVTTAVVASMLVAAGLALSACGTAVQPQAAVPGIVRLGALLPMSGRSAPSGTAMAAAARLAVTEANDTGGVLGRKVELDVIDDACDPGTAVSAAHQLVGRAITVSVGGYCSSATVPTLSTFRAAGVPMIIPASNSTDLLVPRYDSVFLLSGTTTAEAAFAVDRARGIGGHRLAVVHDGTSYSATLASSTTDLARRPGSGVALVAGLEVSQGAPSYARTAATVLASKADTVYYTGYYADANHLITDLRGAGYAGRIIVADGCIDDALFAGLSADQAENVYGTSLPIPAFQPGAAQWSARYKAAAGSQPGANTIEAYDAVRLALDAIRRAGTVNRDAVRAAIAATSDLRLVSGPVTFNPDGTRINPEFLLLRVRNRVFTLASTPAE